MHRRIGAAVLALLMVTSVLAVGAVATVGAQSYAGAQISEQTSGGHTVVVDEVTVPDGGFVTIHDGTVLDGGEDVFWSVRGSSEYLEAGTHEDVTVHLDDPVTDNQTLVATPHRDTDADHIYSFVSSNGEADGPYTADGEPVVDTAEVTASTTVEATDQPTAGSSVLVDRVELSEGGFVTVHDSTVLDGQVFESVRGTSEYLEPGEHEDVEVELDEAYEDDGAVIAMAHQDTNDNEEYDFVDSEGAEDGPYTNSEGEAVLDDATLTVDDEAAGMSDGDGAGFGAIVALLAVLGSALAARRLN